MAKAPERADGARKVISANKLKQLISAGRSTQKDVSSLTGTMREKIANAVENDNLNNSVFASIRRLDRMEPAKLKIWLEDFEHYLDISGLQERAESAPTLEFGPGEEDDEEDDKVVDIDKKGRRKSMREPSSVAAE